MITISGMVQSRARIVTKRCRSERGFGEIGDRVTKRYTLIRRRKGQTVDWKCILFCFSIPDPMPMLFDMLNIWPDIGRYLIIIPFHISDMWSDSEI